MNERTRNILSVDPIATAEAILGKRPNDSDDKTDVMAFLALAARTNQVKSDHLKSIRDTHHGIAWSDFIEIVKAYGFKIGYRQNFTGISCFNNSYDEEEIIFFHEEKGLILHAESYSGKSVNSAKVYGEVKVGDKLEENQCEALHGCSRYGKENGTMSFNLDAREGLRFHLDALSEAFEFSKSWSRVPFLWFLNYMDTKEENYDFEKITKQKIDICTPEVRRIIG